MKRLDLLLAAAALVLVGGGRAWSEASSAPLLDTLGGAPYRASGPQVLMFWRADCGPCLLELSDLSALRAAAQPARLIPVGLQPAAALRPALRRLGLAEGETAVTREDAAAVLTRLGGAPPRLPLAVAFRADGRPCGRHTGLLGRDRVRAWARACGAARA